MIVLFMFMMFTIVMSTSESMLIMMLIDMRIALGVARVRTVRQHYQTNCCLQANTEEALMLINKFLNSIINIYLFSPYLHENHVYSFQIVQIKTTTKRKPNWSKAYNALMMSVWPASLYIAGKACLSTIPHIQILC